MNNEMDIFENDLKIFLSNRTGNKNPIIKKFDFDEQSGVLYISYIDDKFISTIYVCTISSYKDFLESPFSITDSKKTIKDFFDLLKDDEDYYQSWQANIAMAILDGRRWFLEEYSLDEVPKEMEHGLANKIAKNFLNGLLYEI